MPEQTIRPTWYRTERFMLKAEDETYRAERYQAPFSVVTCSLSPFDSAAAGAFQDFVHDHLRQVDFVSRLSLGRYAIGLPFTNAPAAASVVETLRGVLADYQPLVGVGTAPVDGRRAQTLLTTAELSAVPGEPEKSPELARAS